jgi:trehalose-6-phosphate synthase
MPDEEANGRMRQLFGTVEYHDVDRWGREFLDAVKETGNA